jgi:hypothetical protein
MIARTSDRIAEAQAVLRRVATQVAQGAPPVVLDRVRVGG